MKFDPLKYDQDKVCTLDEVAAELGVNRERARQIESEALKKVKLRLLKRGFTEVDLIEHLRDWMS
jgi:DNA-directed RNA polymerase sigma subunit (sigma70/sigma32)